MEIKLHSAEKVVKATAESQLKFFSRVGKEIEGSNNWNAAYQGGNYGHNNNDFQSLIQRRAKMQKVESVEKLYSWLRRTYPGIDFVIS